MKSSQFRIPYMGGKQKYAERIVNRIKELKPKAKYFYDLFGGGGSVSFYAKESGLFEAVFYNDLDTRIVKLIEHLKHHGVTDDMLRWYSREEFHQRIDEQSHIGGLLASCYSFGNNGKDYLFSSDVEQYKKDFHNVVMFGEDRLGEMSQYCMSYVKNKYGVDQALRLEMPVGNTYTERRLHVRKQLNVFEKDCKVGQLERLQQLERFPDRVTNLSYQDVGVNTPPDETVIYCDPPYKGAAKYKQDICHDNFYDWVKNCKYPVFVSSYEFDLPCVMEVETRSTLSATSNATKAVEKLFYKE